MILHLLGIPVSWRDVLQTALEAQICCVDAEMTYESGLQEYSVSTISSVI